MTSTITAPRALRASQRCIEAECGATYQLDERLYVCRRCGGLLEITREFSADESGKTLREEWQRRLASNDARDRSGVWRYRELLPFADDVPVVTLAEGNTPLYDAPRAALRSSPVGSNIRVVTRPVHSKTRG